jgi:hypothetical protein
MSLKTLKLNGNSNRTTLDLFAYPNLSYLNELDELHIDGLRSWIFPIPYRTMMNLKTIVMTGHEGHCNIAEITNETFRNLVHVRHLNLSACNISNVYAGSFEELFELEVLDVRKPKTGTWNAEKHFIRSTLYTN